MSFGLLVDRDRDRNADGGRIWVASYGGHHTTTTTYSSAPTTTSNLISTSGLTGTDASATRDVNTSTGSAVHTGPTTISNNPEASSHTASTGSALKTGSTDTTHVDAAAASQHEPSSPLKDLAAATSPILGSSAGSTSNAAHLAAKESGEKISAHHDPADALKELADATKPVFGSSAGTTTAHAHEEIKAIDQTPAQPLKQLADASAPYGSSTTSSATADKVRESSTSAPNVPTSAQTTEQQEGLAETVSHFGSSALAALGAAATGIVVGANEAVHSATGLDLLHDNPVSPGPVRVARLFADDRALCMGPDVCTGSQREGYRHYYRPAHRIEHYHYWFCGPCYQRSRCCRIVCALC